MKYAAVFWIWLYTFGGKNMNDILIDQSHINYMCYMMKYPFLSSNIGTAETNTTINDQISRYESVSTAIDKFWVDLLLASGMLSNYKELLAKDVQLVKNIIEESYNVDFYMAANVGALVSRMG